MIILVASSAIDTQIENIRGTQQFIYNLWNYIQFGTEQKKPQESSLIRVRHTSYT